MFRSFLVIASKIFYSAVFFFLSLIFLVHYAVAGQAVYGDGIGYYAHLHTWVFDSDWNYTNEYEHIYSPENNNATTPDSVDSVQIVGQTQKGVAANHFFPGTAVLLLPFYVLADWIVGILNIFGLLVARTGYSDIYQILVGLGSVLYVVIGLVFLEKLLVYFFTNVLKARVAVVAILLVTPLLYYGSYDVVNSHGVSFFLSSLFFYLLLTKKNSNTLLIAVVTALAVMTRAQEVVLLVIFVLQRITQVLSQEISQKKFFKEMLVFTVIFLVTLLPLYIYWSETFGSFTDQTYIQAFLNERTTGLAIDWLGSLFSVSNGLFTRSPLLLGLLIWYGYCCYQKKNIFHWQLFLFFLLQFVIISLQAGWKAAAYGGRMYISSLPFFAVILGKLLDEVSKKHLAKIFFLLVFCALLNMFSIFHFVLFAKEAEQGNRGTEERTKQRIQQLLRLKM